MADIPEPRVLDPDRVSRDDRADMTPEDHRSQARLLAKALEESCGYGRQLWTDLSAARQYLHDSLPPEPGDRPPGGASPTGPDDDAGWQRWIDAFASITSILCGPHGDSGFGRESANLIARSRRQVVVPVLPQGADPGVVSELTVTETPQRTLRAASEVPDKPSQAAASGKSGDEEGGSDDATPRAANQGSEAVMPLMYGALGSLITLVALRRRLRASS